MTKAEMEIDLLIREFTAHHNPITLTIGIGPDHPLIEMLTDYKILVNKISKALK